MTRSDRHGPHAGDLLRDGLLAALARPVATASTALVIAIVCVVVLTTTGRSAATEAEVVASIDSVGTRLITVTDTTGRGEIDPSAAAQVAELDGIAWVFGIGVATDVWNAALPRAGTGTPARSLTGTLPADIPIVAGRAPAAGEAVVGSAARQALALSDVAGAISGDPSRGVVGQYHATGPLASLDDMVLVTTDDSTAGPQRQLYALARPDVDVEALARAVQAVVPSRTPQDVEVSTSEGALALRAVISGTLGAASRQLMGIVLATGMALVTISTAGAVAARRRDFGRQRALGASRSAIVVLVLTSSALSGVLGTALGMAVGLPLTASLTGTLPTVTFTCGLGTLTVLVALLGSVPPALAAAYRDPVRILRVP